MSATDHLYFSAKVSHYKTNYDQDGDEIRYVTNVTVAAANLWLAEENVLRKKMGKAGLALPTALSASSPFLMATMDAVAKQVHCPVNKRMSALEFLKHLTERIKIRYDSEYVKPTKDALKSVHDALQSLGILALPKCQHCHKSVPESGLIAHKCCGKTFCDNCSQGMRTCAPGNRFVLNCVCGKSRMIEMS